MHEFTLVRVAQNQLLLVGGFQYSYWKNETLKPNHVLWQGTLTKNEKSVTWIALNVESIPMRLNPICFKLKDNVYIVGENELKNIYPNITKLTGMCNGCFSYLNYSCICCDRYNLKEGKYYSNVHSLPYPLISDEVTNVATDEKDTFAIIPNCNQTLGTGKLLIFTENVGFEEVPYSTELRVKQVSVLGCNKVLLRTKWF